MLTVKVSSIWYRGINWKIKGLTEEVYDSIRMIVVCKINYFLCLE